MSKLIRFIRSLFRLETREEGVATVEYGLMVALIAMVCWLAVTKLGISLNSVFSSAFPKKGGGHGGD